MTGVIQEDLRHHRGDMLDLEDAALVALKVVRSEPLVALRPRPPLEPRKLPRLELGDVAMNSSEPGRDLVDFPGRWIDPGMVLRPAHGRFPLRHRRHPFYHRAHHASSRAAEISRRRPPRARAADAQKILR